MTLSGPYDLFGTDLDLLTTRAHTFLSNVASDKPMYALFSGGKDSLAVAHIASQHPSFAGCIHVNTGIGIEETRVFVREICEQRGWPLYELHPPNMTYDDMVLKYGFPGPTSHLYCYVWLKERALHQFTKGRETLLVSGVRTGESRRRMGTAKWLNEDGPRTWVAPCLDWPTPAMYDYAKVHNLPRNPASQHLHMSGECLCGAFAKPYERYLIGGFFPSALERIEWLEAKAKAVGVHAIWGVSPPKKVKSYPEVASEMFAPLCHDCEGDAA